MTRANTKNSAGYMIFLKFHEDKNDNGSTDRKASESEDSEFGDLDPLHNYINDVRLPGNDYNVEDSIADEAQIKKHSRRIEVCQKHIYKYQ